MPQKIFIRTAISASLLSALNITHAKPVEEVLVLGSKIPKKVLELTHSVSVVNEQQIQNEGYTDVTEILRKQVGVEFKQSGGVGQFNYLKMRGLSSKDILIVVDGVKINKPSRGNTGNLLSQLDPQSIESLEVLRGPQATLYGANNSAGVIVITTKSGDKSAKQIGVEAGSLNWRKVSGSLRDSVDAGNGKVLYSLNVSDTDSDNTHKYEFFEDRTFQGKLALEQDKLKLGLNVLDIDNSFGSAELDETYSGLESRAEHWAFQTPDPRNTSSTTQRVLSVFADHTLTDKLSYKLQISESKNTYEIYDPFDGFLGTQIANIDSIVAGSKKGDTLYIYDRLRRGITTVPLDLNDPKNKANDTKANYEDKTRQYNYDVIYKTNLFNAITGIEKLKQQAKQFGSYGEGDNDDSQLSFYTNGDIHLFDDNVILALGVRHDDYNSWGDHTTGNIGISWQLNNINLYANMGTSFTPATMSQLFNPTYGDSSLTPEKGKTYELGLRQTLLNDKLQLEATIWQTKIKNVIIFDYSVANSRAFRGFGQYNNADKAKTGGIELQGSWQLSNSFNLNGNYTYTDSKRRAAGDDTWQRTVQIARNKANLGLDYQDGDLTLGLNAYYSGPRLRWKGDIEMKEYVRIDASGRYAFNNGLSVSARIENLFDEDIEEGLGYEEPGVYGILGVDYNF